MKLQAPGNYWISDEYLFHDTAQSEGISCNLGFNMTGDIYTVRWDKCHRIVDLHGCTGSGKTAVATLILYNLLSKYSPTSFRFMVGDARGIEFQWVPEAAPSNLVSLLWDVKTKPIEWFEAALAAVDDWDGVTFILLDSYTCVSDSPKFTDLVRAVQGSKRTFLLLSSQDPHLTNGQLVTPRHILLHSNASVSQVVLNNPCASFLTEKFGQAFYAPDIAACPERIQLFWVPWVPDERFWDERTLRKKKREGKLPYDARTLLSRLKPEQSFPTVANCPDIVIFTGDPAGMAESMTWPGTKLIEPGRLDILCNAKGSGVAAFTCDMFNPTALAHYRAYSANEGSFCVDDGVHLPTAAGPIKVTSNIRVEDPNYWDHLHHWVDTIYGINSLVLFTTDAQAMKALDNFMELPNLGIMCMEDVPSSATLHHAANYGVFVLAPGIDAPRVITASGYDDTLPLVPHPPVRGISFQYNRANYVLSDSRPYVMLPEDALNAIKAAYGADEVTVLTDWDAARDKIFERERLFREKDVKNYVQYVQRYGFIPRIVLYVTDDLVDIRMLKTGYSVGVHIIAAPYAHLSSYTRSFFKVEEQGYHPRSEKGIRVRFRNEEAVLNERTPHMNVTDCDDYEVIVRSIKNTYGADIDIAAALSNINEVIDRRLRIFEQAGVSTYLEYSTCVRGTTRILYTAGDTKIPGELLARARTAGVHCITCRPQDPNFFDIRW